VSTYLQEKETTRVNIPKIKAELLLDKVVNWWYYECKERKKMKTNKPKTEKWEKELRMVIERAASVDDCDEIECGIRYVRYLLQQARRKGIKEVVKAIKESKLKDKDYFCSTTCAIQAGDAGIGYGCTCGGEMDVELYNNALSDLEVKISELKKKGKK
jgi:hypothetical protein